MNLSELDELAQALDLLDDVDTIEELLESRGIDVSDDCGRTPVEPPASATASWPPPD